MELGANAGGTGDEDKNVDDFTEDIDDDFGKGALCVFGDKGAGVVDGSGDDIHIVGVGVVVIGIVVGVVVSVVGGGGRDEVGTGEGGGRGSAWSNIEATLLQSPRCLAGWISRTLHIN